MKSKRDTIDIKNIFASEMIYKRVYLYNNILGFPGGAVVKDLPTSVGDAGDAGSTPGSGRSPGGATGTHSSSLARIIPWTEEPGSILMGSQIVRHD